MGNQNKKNQRISTKQAADIFDSTFFDMHPKESWPKWFISHTNLTQIFSEDSTQRIFAIVAAKKIALELGEWYEEIHEKDVVVGFFPGTKSKCYTINHEPEMLIIFSASIDVETSEVTILVDLNMSLINYEELMKLR
jgi:hypothetical protein